MSSDTQSRVHANGGSLPPFAPRASDNAIHDTGARPHPLVIRLAHWIGGPLLVLMAGSGLQIFAAYPTFGARGAEYWWYPFAGTAPPTWLRFGGWLAGARHWHFALAWLFVVTGAIYVLYLLSSGEWRRRLFLPARDVGGALRMLAYYLRLNRTPPPIGFYNGLQRLAYTSVIGFGVLEVASGLALYKPVQLWWLVALLGGYDVARVVHMSGLLLFAGFTITHLVLVALHPRTIPAMITGKAPSHD